MWLLGVVVRRYIDFIILLIPTPLVSVLFYSSILTFCSFFLNLYNYIRSTYAWYFARELWLRGLSIYFFIELMDGNEYVLYFTDFFS